MAGYDLDSKLAIQFKAHTVEFILDPGSWAALSILTMLDWHALRFNKANAKNVPNNEIGVYSFVVMPGIANHPNCAYLMYVGMTIKSLRSRYNKYLQDQRNKDGRPNVVWMLDTYADQLWFCYAPIQQPTLVPEVEHRLLAAYLPPINREFPAEIRNAMALWR